MTGDPLTVLREGIESDSGEYGKQDAALAVVADVEALIQAMREIERSANDGHSLGHIGYLARAALARFPATSPAKEQT